MDISIIVATYNQEKHIRKTLESIVVQKHSCSIEVLVGEDKSTDNTKKIVEEFAVKYPDIIIPFYREKNLGMLKNPLDLIKKSKGKYIAFLEGDDYWIDENKIQKQFDFLEANEDYVAVFGKHIVVDENNSRNVDMEKYIGPFEGEEYTLNDFENYRMPGQTCTVMYRADALRNILFHKAKGHWILPIVPGDRLLILGMLSEGKIINLQEITSAYRYIVKEGAENWSSKYDYFSIRNILIYLIGLRYFEYVGKKLCLPVNFNKRLEYEFSKITHEKNEHPWFEVKMTRLVLFLMYKPKREFFHFIKERKTEYHRNQMSDEWRK